MATSYITNAKGQRVSTVTTSNNKVVSIKPYSAPTSTSSTSSAPKTSTVSSGGGGSSGGGKTVTKTQSSPYGTISTYSDGTISLAPNAQYQGKALAGASITGQGANAGAKPLPVTTAPTTPQQITQTPAINTPIVSPRLGDTTNAIAAANGLGVVATNQQDFLNQQLQIEQQRQGSLKDLLNTYNTRERISDIRANLEKQYNIQGQLSVINSLNESYNSTKAAMETETNRATDAMASTGFISRQQAAIERRYAPTLNRISADINAKAAILSQNQSLLNQAVQDAVADQKYDFEAAKMFYDANQQSFDRLSSTYQNAYQDYVRQKETDYNNAWREKTAIADLIKSNPNANISINDSFDDAMQKYQSAGGDLMQQASLARAYGSLGGGGGLGLEGQGMTQLGQLTPSQIQQVNTVESVGSIINDPGLNKAVGPSITKIFTRGLQTPAKTNFIASTQQLVNSLTLNKLINAKAQGATFGALSEGELKLLAQSASRIGSWAVQKDGNVVGYNTSEKNFKAELDRIKNFQAIDFIRSGGNPSQIGATETPDGGIWMQNADGTVTNINSL